MTRRIIVGMSGGVDSAVAAALLAEAGWDVVGATVRLWPCSHDQPDRACCTSDDISAARQTAAMLEIPHYVVEASLRFREEVLRPAWQEYERARTPNPCIRCNELVKFASLFDLADKLGAEAIATGHHAGIVKDVNGHCLLARGADRNKDQSYFLFRLLPLLCKIQFPIGGLTKAQVRAKAQALGLDVADRPDSQDACLVKSGSGRTDFAEALRELFGAPARPGAMVDGQGRRLGSHQGYHRFTIGQRRGIGVASNQGRLYVTALDPDRALVVLGPREQLLSQGLVASDLIWDGPMEPGDFEVQIRYRHKAVAAWIQPHGSEVLVRFREPQPAVTPGQAAVFYRGDILRGGGWIQRALQADDPILSDLPAPATSSRSETQSPA